MYDTLSERVRTRRAPTTPRGRDTLGRSRTSGESPTSQPRPARVVSGPRRAHATRPPNPFGRCWFPNEKAHSSYRTGRGVRVKKRAPTSRAGRGHRSCAAGPTRAHVDAPPRAFLLPHALTFPPPASTRNRGCRKPHPSHPKTSLRSRSAEQSRRHASHREPRGHAGEQQARASPHRAWWRS